MRLSLFDYHLPVERIAQIPVRPRDHSRLLVVDKQHRKLQHKHFFDLPQFLRKGDVLVFNNSKVIPARLIGKKETGGKIEVFLLHKISSDTWEVLLGGKGKKSSMNIYFSNGLHATVIAPYGRTWKVRFSLSGKKLDDCIARIGKTPIPPYIKKYARLTTYQTVYADDSKTGSVAAPTAGFHFTKPLLKQLKDRGIQTEFVTLHVGLGTFAPVKTSQIEDHAMHPEFVEVAPQVMRRLRKAKKDGNRIIAVGTTSVRTLEAVWNKRGSGYKGLINMFIYPGYRFKAVDAIITNFHLPKSSLLMLVSAFAGRACIMRTYHEAIKRKYRFYSFGDAMLIH